MVLPVKKPSACQRHQPRTWGYIVRLQQRAIGMTLPRFAVFEQAECGRCGEQLRRLMATPRAVDGWEAARLAGVPEADLATVNVRGDEPAPTPTAPSPAVTRPLKCWPFPVSTHYPKAST